MNLSNLFAILQFVVALLNNPAAYQMTPQQALNTSVSMVSVVSLALNSPTSMLLGANPTSTITVTQPPTTDTSTTPIVVNIIPPAPILPPQNPPQPPVVAVAPPVVPIVKQEVLMMTAPGFLYKASSSVMVAFQDGRMSHWTNATATVTFSTPIRIDFDHPNSQADIDQDIANGTTYPMTINDSRNYATTTVYGLIPGDTYEVVIHAESDTQFETHVFDYIH